MERNREELAKARGNPYCTATRALLRFQSEELPWREAGEDVGDFREARFVE